MPYPLPAPRFARATPFVSFLFATLVAACAATPSEDPAASQAQADSTCGSALGDAVLAAAQGGATTVNGSLDSRANRVVSAPIVEGQALGDALYDLVSHAQHEVFVEALEVDERSWLAARLRDAIATLPGTVKVYIMANPAGYKSGGASIFSAIPETRAHLVSRLSAFYNLPNVTVGAWNTGWNLFDVLHSKEIVVDGKRALVLDANLQPNSDPMGSEANALGWYQLGMVLEGEVVSTLRSDAARAWAAAYPNVALPAAPAATPVDACTRTVVLGRNAGDGEGSSADLGYAALLAGAQTTLNVMTPNMNDSGALAALAAATASADVNLVLSHGFNDSAESLPFQGGTNDSAVTKLAGMAADPCKLHVRWFARPSGEINGNGTGASHAKWASADGTAMILGSQNLDVQSWTKSRELSVLVDDASTTAQFDAAFAAVWARATTAYECQ
jgi:phosphatidylserine/phosphatidylglycerophosphate/cardiolipin synthase-like enzyme